MLFAKNKAGFYKAFNNIFLKKMDVMLQRKFCMKVFTTSLLWH